MIRSLFSLVSNTILVAVLLASVVCFGYFFDALGILSIPDQVWSVPLSLLTPRPTPAVTLTVPRAGTPTWTSLIPTQPPRAEVVFDPPAPLEPADTPEPTETPPPTPVPPMPAPEYRDAVMLSLKSFAQAGQNWLEANDELTADPSLAADPTWQSKAARLTGQVVSAAQDLDQIGPAPAQYAGVDAQLKRLLPEAFALRQNYTAALQTGEAGWYQAAAHSFAQIKEILTLAVGEMSAAGWPQ